MSSNNLDKYEYLTGEDLGLKPSTVEQTKFEYSPLGKIFNEGLDEEDKKEGLFKRLENIKDKNEELLNGFSANIEVSKAPKIESDYNHDIKDAFNIFYRDLKKFKRISLGSKHDEINDFYKLFNSFINMHKATTNETKDRKDKTIKYDKPLYNGYFNA